ncbi:MAG: hypothetical protein HOC23_06765, partial [Halieaceae bacterium]|nr:hypothetical protein [Halieaceae bacterium]
MRRASTMRLYVFLTVLLTLTVFGCSDSSDNAIAPPVVEPDPQPTATYSAQVRRTEYGIPHIKADDWGSLGYGYGYAFAQDSFCVVMREIVLASGRSAELMGEAEGNADADFLLGLINGSKEKLRADFYDLMPVYAQELVAGYVAGMNRYLTETGIENLPEGDRGCRNADWVFAFDDVDLLMFLRNFTLGGSSGQGIVRDALLATMGPDQQTRVSAPASKLALEQVRADLGQFAKALVSGDRGSNGLALGRDATQNGSGLLLGNPHQPWFGSGAWHEAHLTIPGVYDVAGATLQGTPFIGIGFNRDLAWTHTVSFANRFSFYELKLNPDNPLQYDYDGEWRDITEQVVAIQVQLADGTLETRSHTFYLSHYGPIANLQSVSALLGGWPMFNGSVLAFRDANVATGPRTIEQWIEKGKAANLDQYVEALSIIGNPVFHDLAADRSGEAFYGEISAIPFVTQQQFDLCINGLIGPLLADATTNVIVSLDGSNSQCEWGDSPDAPAGSNLYSSADLPQIRTTDYVSNSNNSYWLSDANNPLEGFPTIMGPLGPEGGQQFLRTRLGHLMVAQRKNASDGLSDTPLFDLDTVKNMMYSNRVYAAELVLDDVLDVCATGDAAAVAQACAVLAAWDRRVNLQSRGAQVFTEFWGYIRGQIGSPFQNTVVSDEFWTMDFDPQRPITTPAGIDTSVAANQALVIAGLASATQRLADANVSMDAPWGDIQYLQRNNENVPIHGGSGPMGVYGAIGVGLRDGGYINPGSGNSY